MAKKTASVAINGLLPSSEAIIYLTRKIEGFKDTTFRNAIHLKNLKPTKKESKGKQKVLLFSTKDLESFASYYNNRKSKGKKGIAGKVKFIPSKDKTELSISIYKSQLETLSKNGITEMKVQEVLTNKFKEIYEKVAQRERDIEERIAQARQDLPPIEI